MHRFANSLRARVSTSIAPSVAVFVVIGILGWHVSAIGVPAAHAEPLRATPTPQANNRNPTPQPNLRPEDLLRRLLSTAPLRATPSSRAPSSRTDVGQGTTKAMAEGASLSGEQEPARDSDAPLLADAPADMINIVLLGTDKRPEWGHWRTDTIIIVSINPEAESVGMLSIPRDLWIKIPKFGVGRINTVDFIGEWKDAEGGGPGLLKRTIEANLGIPVHRYARIDLEGFIEVVNALGGVTIDVACPIQDAFLDEPLTGEEGFAELDLDAGVHHLDGLEALRYARSRRIGADFNRAERQQNVLRSLAEQNLNWHLVSKLPDLWTALSDAVETDLTLGEMLKLVSVGVQIQQDKIKSRVIDWRTTENWVTAGGAMVLLPNRETLPQAVDEFLNPPRHDSRLDVERARIEIYNGTGLEGMAELAATRLRRQGFDVVETTGAGHTSRTLIIVNQEKPHSLKRLLKVLRLDPESVVHSPEPDNRTDIRIILGDDWDPCS